MLVPFRSFAFLKMFSLSLNHTSLQAIVLGLLLLFLPALCARSISPHSLCLAVLLLTLNGPSFHILPSFLYYVPLFCQSLCYFVSNDPLAPPVYCECFQHPRCIVHISFMYVHVCIEASTFLNFPCSSQTFCSTFANFS